jgi:hypothetical protein
VAPVAANLIERRRERRCEGGGERWQCRAVLRPGQSITLINISSRAALVESGTRLRPGAHTDVQLAGSGMRASVKARLDRCYVAALEPLRYRGVLMFEQCVDLGTERHGPHE